MQAALAQIRALEADVVLLRRAVSVEPVGDLARLEAENLRLAGELARVTAENERLKVRLARADLRTLRRVAGR